MTQYLRIADRAEQLEVAPVTEDDELACGKCDAVAVSVPPLPHGKANQLETGELTLDEMDLCVGQLAHRFSLFVTENLDFDVHGIPRRKWPDHARPGLVSLRCYAFASSRSVVGDPIRFHSQCWSVFSPTSTGSADAKSCCSSRYRARCQSSSVASTRTRRADNFARAGLNAIGSAAIADTSES